jgi:rRNA biogenesis protein RRP5
MTVAGPSPDKVVEDFERCLVGSPNSSLLWIKYMSTVLQIFDITKARSVAERALTTISFKEEQERMNIWTAYLNMENLAGNSASLQKVFDRSVVYCDSRAMYMQLAQLYERSKKYDEATATYQTMIKKFGQSCKVWLAYAECLFQNDVNKGRKILVMSLKSLPKRKHEKITIKFAQLEYRHGSTERARTLFEGVLSNSPKRIDLWSIYLTMEENLCKKHSEDANKLFLRRLFERVVHMRLSSKKAKYFFKRFLEFEKNFGTDSTVEHVKELARQYVESSCGGGK